MDFTPDQVMEEARRRTRVAKRLEAGPLVMAAKLGRGVEVPPHLELINRWLIDVAKRERRRIIIEAPPRHGKSESCSHWFPAWYLSLFPRHRVILSSYEAGYAAEWGRKVRNTLTENAAAVGVQLAQDSTAADRWHTDRGGGMVTAGVGGAINGRGAEVLLVDDPLKNREEAESEARRRAVWAWWTSTAYTRLEPDAVAVIIMTRWHEDDLAGRLQAEAAKGGEQWDVLSLPAIAEEDDPLGRPVGEPLWEKRYNRAALATTRKAIGSREWSALYQQRPAPAKGAMFDKDWWRYWRRATDPQPADPAVARRTIVLPARFDEIMVSADLAFKDTTGSDFVAIGVWGVSGPRRMLLDLYWERADFIKTLAEFKKLVARWPGNLARAKLVEDKANGPAVIASLRRSVPGLIAIQPQGSKSARAAATSPFVEAGDVFLPAHAPWLAEYIQEHTSFPVGAHDDAVDQQSQALNYLASRSYKDPVPAPAVGSDEHEAAIEAAMLDEDLRKAAEEADLW